MINAELLGKFCKVLSLLTSAKCLLSVTAIKKLIDTYGDEIVNKKSTTWRSLPEIDRQLPLIELLQAYPALIKRPIIKDQNGNYSVGWTAQIIEKFQSV